MEKDTIFIYLVRGGKVVQDACKCYEKGKHTYRIFDKRRRMQIVSDGQLGICERNRIVSFEDDLPKFRQLLIEDMENRIEMAEQKLNEKKELLNSIKQY